MPYQIFQQWMPNGSNQQILLETDSGDSWTWDDGTASAPGSAGPSWRPIPRLPHHHAPLAAAINGVPGLPPSGATSPVVLTHLLKRAIQLNREQMRGYNFQPTDLDQLEADCKNAGVNLP